VLKTGDPESFLLLFSLLLLTALFLLSVIRGHSPSFLLFLFWEAGSARDRVIFVVAVTLVPVFLLFLL